MANPAITQVTVNSMTKDNDILFGMHKLTLQNVCSSEWNSHCEIELFPASFNSYFDQVKSDRILAIEEIMKYEWNRIRSFRTFPRKSPVYAIHLARAGFYYAGQDDDVLCFSCGARHSNWRHCDSPIDVHRHMSPNCRFINGDDLRNVPISNDIIGHEINYCQTSPCSHKCSGACECHNSLEFKNVATRDIPDTWANNLIDTNHNINTRGQSDNDASSCSGTELIVHTVRKDHACLISHLNRSEAGVDDGYVKSLDSTTADSAEFSCPGTPRYSGYAVLAVRISSFDGWPVYSRITPRCLAEAGLFYVGFGDCVKCFFCGGGLRNWEPQDNPWVEHARWYPRCPYVLHSRGTEFMHAAQRLVLEQQLSHISIAENITEIGVDEVSLPLNGTCGYSTDSILSNSAAAQSAREMGYSHYIVRDAIRQLRRQRGTDVFSVQTLLSLILENEENEAESVAPCSRGNGRSNSTFGNSTHGHNAGKDESKKELDSAAASNNDERILSLVQENRQLKEHSLCKMCRKEPCCIVLLPCGHLVTCSECAPALRKCPICRKVIKGTVRAYIS